MTTQCTLQDVEIRKIDGSGLSYVNMNTRICGIGSSISEIREREGAFRWAARLPHWRDVLVAYLGVGDLLRKSIKLVFDFQDVAGSRASGLCSTATSATQLGTIPAKYHKERK